jgi:hypothetical protein
MNTTPAPTPAARRVLPQRKATPPPAVPRPSSRVLQGGRAPAQLSLLLRPVLTLR